MGCLRALFVQVGCVVVLVAAAILGFIFRDQVADGYRRVRGLPPRVEAVFAPPASGGAARAEAALEALERRGGPAYVDLTAGELAAVVDAALARSPGRVLDSVEVALLNDEVLVRGSLEVTGLPRSLFGPLAGAIGPREPVLIGGPLYADSAGNEGELAGGGRGRLWWRVTTLRVRDFPFPRATIAPLLRQLRIPGVAGGGAVALPGAPGVGDVRVSRRGVRLYRSEPR